MTGTMADSNARWIWVWLALALPAMAGAGVETDADRPGGGFILAAHGGGMVVIGVLAGTEALAASRARSSLLLRGTAQDVA